MLIIPSTNYNTLVTVSPPYKITEYNTVVSHNISRHDCQISNAGGC